jgi:hypothetical protein
MQTRGDRLEALRRVLAEPVFRRIELSTLGSYGGEATALVAFSVLAYRIGGPWGIALLVAVQMLPAAALVPFLSRVAERARRERALVAVDGMRLLIAVTAWLLELSGQPRSLLLPLAAGLTTLSAVSNSVRRSLLPLLVSGPSELTALCVATSVVQAAAQTGGPLLAGVLFAFATPSAVLLAAAACFALALVAAFGLPDTTAVAVRPAGAARFSPVRGIRAIRTQRDLRLATGLFAAKNLGRGALNVFVVLIALRLVDVGSAGVGWLTAAVGAGGVVGGLAAARLVGIRRLATPMAVGVAFWGLAFLLVAAAPQLGVAIVALLGVGVGNTLADVAGYSLVGRSARDDTLARVYAVHEAVRALAITAGAGAAALVAATAGTRESLVAAGVVITAAALAGFARGRTETPVPPPEHLDVLRATPLLGWLAPVALERVATTLRPVEIAADEVLMIEGDDGDDAYLVMTGELVAERDGVAVGTISRGGVVGEIALLRDTPRTATVRALVDSRLLAIDRDEFLAAATGSAAAREASDDLVDQRLGVSV